MRIAVEMLGGIALLTSVPAVAQDAVAPRDQEVLSEASAEAQRQLRHTFTSLQFEEFGPSPVRGPIYQANAGGRILYFAPESGHLLFAAVYDRSGVNLTALAQDASARKRLGAVDPKQALMIGPPGAPQVIEFTDPDCPYCQALERFWHSKAAEGRPVQRLVYFVSGIHPQAAAKAEHILCSPDPQAAFTAVYAGHKPPQLLRCDAGARQVQAHALTVRNMGVTGTPTLFVAGKMISGFQQAELEAWLTRPASNPDAR